MTYLTPYQRGNGETIAPIDLPDDGLRVTYAGQTSDGSRVICLHNPFLIAEVVAVKALRRSIRETNIRKYS